MSEEVALTSRQNPRIKYFRSLHDRKKAQREGVLLVEGVRLLEEALQSGLVPQMLIFTKNRQSLALEWSERFSFSKKAKMLLVSDELMKKTVSTLHPQGIAAVVAAPETAGSIPASGNDLYLISDGVSDPGNMGTMIRTADAFAFSAVILSSDSVDPFNEKAIRASMGSCFHIPIIRLGSIGEICLIIKRMGVQLIASHLSGRSLSSVGFRFPAGLVVGNEARGISRECLDQCDMMVKIPMPGAAESLNAASAHAILSYLLRREEEKTK
ncbi:MAG: RNA methyltransferase [Clostridiales bacterium]|nr:RNA methyltransferase [Clostridiales bacterium]